jgi:hypothetical protein
MRCKGEVMFKSCLMNCREELLVYRFVMARPILSHPKHHRASSLSLCILHIGPSTYKPRPGRAMNAQNPPRDPPPASPSSSRLEKVKTNAAYLALGSRAGQAPASLATRSALTTTRYLCSFGLIAVTRLMIGTCSSM